MRLTRIISVACVALLLGLAGSGVVSAGLVVGLLFGAGVIQFAWLLLRKRSRPEPMLELDTVAFSDVVDVKARSPRLGGRFVRVRLLVGPGTIATRVVLKPHLVSKTVFQSDYTVRAADFQVVLRPTGLLSRVVGSMNISGEVRPGVWDRSIVLSGPNPDGPGQLELQIFRSDRASCEEVEQALIRAGARPVAEPATG